MRRLKFNMPLRNDRWSIMATQTPFNNTSHIRISKNALHIPRLQLVGLRRDIREVISHRTSNVAHRHLRINKDNDLHQHKMVNRDSPRSLAQIPSFKCLPPGQPRTQSLRL